MKPSFPKDRDMFRATQWQKVPLGPLITVIGHCNQLMMQTEGRQTWGTSTGRRSPRPDRKAIPLFSIRVNIVYCGRWSGKKPETTERGRVPYPQVCVCTCCTMEVLVIWNSEATSSFSIVHIQSQSYKLVCLYSARRLESVGSLLVFGLCRVQQHFDHMTAVIFNSKCHCSLSPQMLRHGIQLWQSRDTKHVTWRPFNQYFEATLNI